MNRTFLSVVLLLSLFVLMMVASAWGNGNWVSPNGNSSPAKPSAVVLSSNESETVVKIAYSGFWSKEVIEDNVTFQQLKFPGYAGNLEIGQPNLPVVSELVGIPGSANVSVSVVDYKEVTLTGYNVYPFQTPLRENEKRVSFDIDRATYQQNAFYPEALASVGEPGIWRDLRVVDLRVTPFQFNPVTGELKAYTEITVKLSYTGVSAVNVKGSQTRPISSDYARMYSQSVLNFPQLRLHVGDDLPDLPEFDAAYDYLIICEDAYMSNMTAFVNHKTAMGLSTNMVAASTAGSNYTAIKSYIQNEYNTNGIRYVLLVGDEGDIPGYTGYGFFSDYYYSLLDGSDDYADIAIGRFCVQNAGEVDNMVSKSITFEANAPGGDWLEKSLLIANWELAPSKYQECKEEVRTAAETASGTYSVLYPNFTTCYGASYANGGDEASNADVINYFNEGFRLVNYRGHGDNTIWWYWNVYGEHFEISDVNAINNGQLTPVVFSIACLNANLSSGSQTLAEAFTVCDDASVAFLGASDPSYTTPNHDYDKQLYAVVFDEGINAVGDASNEASVRVINLWGSYGITNARMYLWLGDPALELIYGGTVGLPAPVLVSPDDGAYFDDPAQPLLDWLEVDGAVSYHVQIDDNDDFSSPVGDEQGVTATEWTTPSLTTGIYHWRVCAYDGEREGTWSVVRTIYVGIQIEAPVLYAPADNSKIRNRANIELQWYEVANAAGYEIEIDNNSDFSSPERSATSSSCTGGLCSYTIWPNLFPGDYYWRVKVAEDGWPWSEVWSFKIQGQVRKDGVDGVPANTELHANYPNPFNPTTEISFGLPQAGHVSLEIFNINGQKLATLVNNTMEAGYHTVTWDGSSAASGIYLYRLVTEENVLTRKMLLVK